MSINGIRGLFFYKVDMANMLADSCMFAHSNTKSNIHLESCPPDVLVTHLALQQLNALYVPELTC